MLARRRPTIGRGTLLLEPEALLQQLKNDREQGCHDGSESSQESSCNQLHSVPLFQADSRVDFVFSHLMLIHDRIAVTNPGQIQHMVKGMV